MLCTLDRKNAIETLPHNYIWLHPCMGTVDIFTMSDTTISEECRVWPDGMWIYTCRYIDGWHKDVCEYRC